MDNKHFWKFVAGFLGIVVLAIVALWGFESLQTYKENQARETVLTEY